MVKSINIEPVDSGIYEQLKATAEVLNDIFKPYGFALLIFDFGNNGRLNYISNAERETMISAMKEFIAVQEGRAFSQDDTQ